MKFVRITHNSSSISVNFGQYPCFWLKLTESQTENLYYAFHFGFIAETNFFGHFVWNEMILITMDLITCKAFCSFCFYFILFGQRDVIKETNINKILNVQHNIQPNLILSLPLVMFLYRNIIMKTNLTSPILDYPKKIKKIPNFTIQIPIGQVFVSFFHAHILE